MKLSNIQLYKNEAILSIYSWKVQSFSYLHIFLMTSLHLSASVDKPSFTVWVLNKCQDTVLVSRPVLRGTKADSDKRKLIHLVKEPKRMTIHQCKINICLMTTV